MGTSCRKIDEYDHYPEQKPTLPIPANEQAILHRPPTIYRSRPTIIPMDAERPPNTKRLGKRLALYALVGVSLLALLAQPVAAAYDSTAEALIRNLNQRLLYVAIPITILVELILFYAVWKFRDNDDPKPTEENRRLEITWTVATALVLLFVGFASYGVMAELIPPPGNPEAPANEDAVEVTAIGQTWFWTFEYPGEEVSTTGTMVIPVDRQVELDVTAEEWLHAVHVPELGLKQDAIPGQTNTLVFTATSTGEYQLYCAEYCGTGHSEMLGTVEVVSQEEYEQWLAGERDGDGGDGDDDGDGNESAVDPDASESVVAIGSA